jgi:hypothetical protein
MSRRIVVAALLFVSSAAFAVPNYAQAQSPSSVLDVQAKSESSTPAPSTMQARPAPTVRSFSDQQTSANTSGAKAVQLQPSAKHPK